MPRTHSLLRNSLVAAAAALACVAAPAPVAHSAGDAEMMTDAEIRAWFAGSVVRATLAGEGKKYIWRFDHDGTLTSVKREDDKGTWRAKDDKLCLTFAEVVKFSPVSGKAYVRNYVLTGDCSEITGSGLSVKATAPITGVFKARFSKVDTGAGSDVKLAQLSDMAPPLPPNCATAGSETFIECQRWRKEYEAWKAAHDSLADASPPKLRVQAPDRVDVRDGVFRVKGLVGDDGGAPRLAVDGEAVPLSAPGSGDESLAKHTRAFNFQVIADEVGLKRLHLEACDPLGNCVSRQLLVRVEGASTAATAAAPRSDEEVEDLRRRLEEAERERQQAEAERLAMQEEARRLAEAKRQAEAQARRQDELEAEKRQGGAEDQPPQDRLALIQRQLEELALQRTVLDTTLPLIKADLPERIEVGDRARITGMVGDNGGPPRLRVDGETAPLFRLEGDERPIAEHTLAFRLDVDTRTVGERRYLLEACDASANCVAREIAVRVVPANRPNTTARNHALIIGNDQYLHLPDLKTAVGDARAVAKVLTGRYAFDAADVRLLLNADRRAIYTELSSLRRDLAPEDRLLIYYAGHGQIDTASEEGFWQPVDALPNADYTWIDNGDIRRYLRGMPAKHVLVVADSCFSGTLTRSVEIGPDIPRDRFFTEIDSFVSRKVISSGGTEPVADSGSGGHSVFAHYLLKTLRDNEQPYVTAFELFTKFVRAVTNNSDQKPLYGSVADAGDEGAGDFTFILR